MSLSAGLALLRTKKHKGKKGLTPKSCPLSLLSLEFPKGGRDFGIVILGFC